MLATEDNLAREGDNDGENGPTPFEQKRSTNHRSTRSGTPLSLEDARRLVEDCVEHYNNVRPNSATGYITPKDMLTGRQQEIHAERDRKLEGAREQRQSRRQQAA